jgi:Acyltransferase family
MSERDRYVDLLRTLALVSVILGHWTMAAISVDADGSVSVSNALGTVPSLHVVTWILQLVPLFFFVGGVANAAVWRRAVTSGEGTSRYLRRRLVGLLRPAVALVLVAPVSAAILIVAGVPGGLTLRVLVLVLLPLWFLTVYAPLTAVVPWLLQLHDRFGIRVPILLTATIALLDLARHITGRVEFGWPNILLVYALAQQLGFAYADGRLLQVPRRWLLLWAGAALSSLIAATASPIWPTSMVGLPGELSNMTPPGIPLLCLLLLHVPVALLLRPAALPMLQRPRVQAAVDVASRRSMTAFLWHLPLLVAVAGLLLLLGVPFPSVGSPMWWWTRPLWLAALTLLGLLFVAWTGERSPALQRRH